MKKKLNIYADGGPISPLEMFVKIYNQNQKKPTTSSSGNQSVPKKQSTPTSIVDYLDSHGIDSSYSARKKIASQ